MIKEPDFILLHFKCIHWNHCIQRVPQSWCEFTHIQAINYYIRNTSIRASVFVVYIQCNKFFIFSIWLVIERFENEIKRNKWVAEKMKITSFWRIISRIYFEARISAWSILACLFGVDALAASLASSILRLLVSIRFSISNYTCTLLSWVQLNRSSHTLESFK